MTPAASCRELATVSPVSTTPLLLASFHTFTSEPFSVVFLTLAAGSIVYVIVQLLAIAGRSTRKELIYAGVLLGLLAGFLTDAIVTAAGV